jgi:hypothetical protein
MPARSVRVAALNFTRRREKNEERKISLWPVRVPGEVADSREAAKGAKALYRTLNPKLRLAKFLRRASTFAYASVDSRTSPAEALAKAGRAPAKIVWCRVAAGPGQYR